MPVPSYTDISRFRAPYLNAYFSGYGQDPGAPPGSPPPVPGELPPGTPPPVPAEVVPAAPPLPSPADMTTVNKAGYRVLKPEWMGLFNNILGHWIVGAPVNAAPPAKGFTVSLTRVSAEEQAAAVADPKIAENILNRSARRFIQVQTDPNNPPRRVVFVEDGTLAVLLTGIVPPGAENLVRLFALASDDPQVEQGKCPAPPAPCHAGVLLGGVPGQKSEGKLPAPGEKDMSVAATVGIAVAAIAVVGGVYVVTRKKGAPPPRIED